MNGDVGQKGNAGDEDDIGPLNMETPQAEAATEEASAVQDFVAVDLIIEKLLAVRDQKPGTIVDLAEYEIRMLCTQALAQALSDSPRTAGASLTLPLRRRRLGRFSSPKAPSSG